MGNPFIYYKPNIKSGIYGLSSPRNQLIVSLFARFLGHIATSLKEIFSMHPILDVFWNFWNDHHFEAMGMCIWLAAGMIFHPEMMTILYTQQKCFQKLWGSQV